MLAGLVSPRLFRFSLRVGFSYSHFWVNGDRDRKRETETEREGWIKMEREIWKVREEGNGLIHMNMELKLV